MPAKDGDGANNATLITIVLNVNFTTMQLTSTIVMTHDEHGDLDNGPAFASFLSPPQQEVQQEEQQGVARLADLIARIKRSASPASIPSSSSTSHSPLAVEAQFAAGMAFTAADAPLDETITSVLTSSIARDFASALSVDSTRVLVTDIARHAGSDRTAATIVFLPVDNSSSINTGNPDEAPSPADLRTMALNALFPGAFPNGPVSPNVNATSALMGGFATSSVDTASTAGENNVVTQSPTSCTLIRE